ncbi:MAG: hypothetical protein QX203_16175, partial [Methylococcaceae bacterium]
TDVTVTLNQGETYLVNGGVMAGAKISATKGIGVYSIAGDVGSTYENRWFAIAPSDQWTNSYYAPVGTTLSTDPAYVFVYNPSTTSSIRVYYDTQTTTGSYIDVAANTAKYVQMPSSAAHFYTASSADKFYAISTIDSDATANQTHDWSYSLVPESYLTTKFVLAWAPGFNNTTGSGYTSSTSGVLNGSPVWVTAPKATTLYIDYAGNGWNAGQGDITYNIKALESYRIFDTSDKNQSGLTVYTTDGTPITAAWGEDPSIAGAGNPYLDMGYTVSPFPDYIFKKDSKEASTATYGAGVSDNDTLIELGEQIEYTVNVTNRSVIDLFNMNIKDNFTPATSATYVPGSTSLTIYKPDGSLFWSIADLDGAGNTFPLETSSGGYILADADPNTGGIQGLKVGYQAVFKYRVEVRGDINQALADQNMSITNNATLAGDGGVNMPVTNDTVLSVPNIDGQVFLYNSGYTAIASSYQEGDTLGLQVTDNDVNKNTAAAETLTVTVTNTTTGETEAVTLTETGISTGIFRATLSTSTTGSNNGNNSGTLYMVKGDSIKVDYTDPIYGAAFDNILHPGIPNGDDNNINTGNANTATATVAVPSQIKILYLSDDGAGGDGTG